MPNNDPNDFIETMEELYNALEGVVEMSISMYKHIIDLGIPEPLAEKTAIEQMKQYIARLKAKIQKEIDIYDTK